MEILTFIVVGLIAGWIAGLIMKGRGFGVGGDIVVGILGALIGGFVFNALDIGTGGFLGSLLTAIVGAVILLALVSLYKRKTHHTGL